MSTQEEDAMPTEPHPAKLFLISKHNFSLCDFGFVNILCVNKCHDIYYDFVFDAAFTA